MVTIQTKLSYPEHFLADFSRRQWASAGARSAWESRITAIGQQFAAAERASIEAGIRSACLQSISPEQLADLSQRAAVRGLVVTPMSTQGRPESYAASAVQQPATGPWDYRVALTTMGGAGPFAEAWQANDDATIGALLGYPECCRRFFAETWGAGSVDPTWEMADHGDGPAEANILLRWLGVRCVPYMPCGFRCEGTIVFGRKLRKLIPEREREWMNELLSMPMLWSSLNGIGEVVTPIVTLNFRSDVAHELREIRREGTSYPEAGAHGLRLPYRPPPARRVDERLWTDNGFGSLDAMERAHRVITSVLPAGPRSVLDLGCGNGLLARKLAGVKGKAFGVELDDGRAQRARKYLDDVARGDLFSVDWGRWRPVDLVILMPGRLVESPSDNLLFKLGRVMGIGPGGELKLVYAYGDWLERYDSLEELCRAAGMKGGIRNEARGTDVAAGLWM